MKRRQRCLFQRSLAIVGCLVIIIGLATMINLSAGLPTVYLTMEGECVRVIADNGTELDCSMIDLEADRYHPVRVPSDTDVAVMTGH